MPFSLVRQTPYPSVAVPFRVISNPIGSGPNARQGVSSSPCLCGTWTLFRSGFTTSRPRPIQDSGSSVPFADAENALTCTLMELGPGTHYFPNISARESLENECRFSRETSTTIAALACAFSISPLCWSFGDGATTGSVTVTGATVRSQPASRKSP